MTIIFAFNIIIAMKITYPNWFVIIFKFKKFFNILVLSLITSFSFSGLRRFLLSLIILSSVFGFFYLFLPLQTLLKHIGLVVFDLKTHNFFLDTTHRFLRLRNIPNQSIIPSGFSNWSSSFLFPQIHPYLLRKCQLVQQINLLFLF